MIGEEHWSSDKDQDQERRRLYALEKEVESKAAQLMPESSRPEVDENFLVDCLNNNEVGDGALYAYLNRGLFLYNSTPKDGEWMRWNGTIWEHDYFDDSLLAVKFVAQAFEDFADKEQEALKKEEIKKDDPEYWLVQRIAKLRKRVDRLRTEGGARRTLNWARIFDTSMACRESDFDRHPLLLPAANGVINLAARTGVLIKADPAARMTRQLAVRAYKHAPYTAWEQFVTEVSGGAHIASFLKRLFGYAITGQSNEQYIAVFIGNGRNGKGVLFSCLSAVLGPYYHVISPSLLTEQKVDPPPNAASEHLYALFGKRVVVAGEAKRGQRIDAGRLKGITGDDAIECRPNFGKSFVFNPTHTIFLHTNHMPVGMGSEFSLAQRLLKIDFPWAYVDDPATEAKKYPAMADRFRAKDKTLKDKLLSDEGKEGILCWLIEGCMEWHERGLDPPAEILESASELARAEDYLGEFIVDCLVSTPDNPETCLSFPGIYDTFLWWWRNNQGDPKRAPSNRTLAKAMRDRGYRLDKRGGVLHQYAVEINREATFAMGGNTP